MLFCRDDMRARTNTGHADIHVPPFLCAAAIVIGRLVTHALLLTAEGITRPCTPQRTPCACSCSAYSCGVSRVTRRACSARNPASDGYVA